jgi:phage gp29-like protein
MLWMLATTGFASFEFEAAGKRGRNEASGSQDDDDIDSGDGAGREKNMANIVDQWVSRFKARSCMNRKQQSCSSCMEYANHPSRGLTPVRLASIMQQAEQGNLTAQAELFADMEEKDAHIYAEMSKRKGAILSIDYEIRPPRNPSAEEKSLTAYLTEMVQDIASLDTILIDALDGIGHGYSCQEIEWQILGSEWLPKKSLIVHRVGLTLVALIRMSYACAIIPLTVQR